MWKIMPKERRKNKKKSKNIENQNLIASMPMKKALIPIAELFCKNQKYLLISPPCKHNIIIVSHGIVRSNELTPPIGPNETDPHIGIRNWLQYQLLNCFVKTKSIY